MNDFDDENIFGPTSGPRPGIKKNLPMKSSKNKKAPDFTSSIELPQKKSHLNATSKAGKKNLDF